MCDKIIYRIERWGEGPFVQNDVPAFIRDSIPGMVKDCFGTEENYAKSKPAVNDYYCAFPDFNTLQEIFGDFINILLELGYKVLEIVIDESEIIMGESKKQVVFKKELVKQEKVFLEL